MASVLDRPAPPADETIDYGTAPEQVYDVRLPTGAARRVTVVIVHGGFWRPAIDRTHAGSQAAALAHDGFHVVVPEYRRPRSGGWPQMRTDLVAVLTALEQREDLPRGIVLVGHSAGGHLVAWLAVQPEARQVLGAVSLAGCVDLRLVHELGLGDGAAQALMGSTPQRAPQEWAAADPARLGAPPVPVVAIHGTDDVTVPVQISRSYARAVPEVSVQVVDGADHLALIDPRSAAFDLVRTTVARLAGSPTP